MKSSTSAEHCPSTLTAFEHQASIIQTHDPPLSVLLEYCAQNTVRSMRAADECILHILTETGLLWCGRAIWWIIVPLTVVNTRCVVYNSRSHTLNLYVCGSVRVSVCVFVSVCVWERESGNRAGVMFAFWKKIVVFNYRCIFVLIVHWMSVVCLISFNGVLLPQKFCCWLFVLCLIALLSSTLWMFQLSLWHSVLEGN